MPNLAGMRLPYVADLFKGASRARPMYEDMAQVAKYERAMGGGGRAVARSSGARGLRKRTRRYAIRGGIAAGALGTAYGMGRSSGVQGITPQASGSGGYPTGMYGM